MKFDVTALDKPRLIRALYKYAFVRGYGVVQNRKRKRVDDDEISISEAKQLFKTHTRIRFDGKKILDLDYIHGKRMKIEIDFSKEREVLDAWDYDYGNGRYRLLYALLSEFGSDSIIITRKGYPAQFPKPKQLDYDKLKKEHRDFNYDVHIAEMKSKFELN